MNLSQWELSTITLASLSITLFLFRLYFRAEIYADMYIGENDVYGIADVIELLCAVTALILAAVSVIVAIVTLFKKQV